MGQAAHPRRVFCRVLLLDPSRRLVIGHRGARAVRPENTLASLRHAAALGVDALESDLHLARDGEPVLHHDPTLDRTTDARGPIRERSSAELAQVNAAYRFSTDGGRSFAFRDRPEPVPSLREALAAIPDLPPIIEMKSVEVARPALAVLRETQNLHRVLVGSFLDEALIPFQEAGVPVSPGSGTLTRQYLPALAGARPTRLPYQALCIPPFHRIIPCPSSALRR